MIQYVYICTGHERDSASTPAAHVSLLGAGGRAWPGALDANLVLENHSPPTAANPKLPRLCPSPQQVPPERTLKAAPFLRDEPNLRVLQGPVTGSHRGANNPHGGAARTRLGGGGAPRRLSCSL